MKTIIVTGTPGTGKTTLSKNLAERLNFHYLDVNLIIKKYGLSEGYDKKRKTKIIDVKRLNWALIKEISICGKKITLTKKPIENNKNKTIKNKKNKIKLQNIKKGIVIDSHLSHYLPNKYADLCIVAKCDLRILKQRLKNKNYSKEKARENMDAEIFDVCLEEAKENNHKIFIVDTTNGVNLTEISRKIGGLIGFKQG